MIHTNNVSEALTFLLGRVSRTVKGENSFMKHDCGSCLPGS